MRIMRCLLLVALSAAPALAQSADTVLTNGKIVTLETVGIVEALAVTDGKIVATGRYDHAARRPGDAADRSRRAHGDPRPDRIAHACDPRGAVLRDRGQLDRHEVPP